MKKALLILIFISYTLTSLGQNNGSQNLTDFSIVKVYDLINLKLIPSDKNQLIVSGANKDLVQVINKNGILKIRMAFKQSFDGENTNVTLYYKSLGSIDANEGSKVTVEGTINAPKFELRVQEGAEITAQLNATSATLRAVTGGIINLQGKAITQDIIINSGGVFNGNNFLTEITEVSVNAGGEAKINASVNAIVKIRAGGNVYVYGKPSSIEETIFINGKVTEM